MPAFVDPESVSIFLWVTHQVLVASLIVFCLTWLVCLVGYDWGNRYERIRHGSCCQYDLDCVHFEFAGSAGSGWRLDCCRSRHQVLAA